MNRRGFLLRSTAATVGLGTLASSTTKATPPSTSPPSAGRPTESPSPPIPWGTSKDFDELMKNRGVEPPLPGYTDEDAFPWVIDSLKACLATAEKCGVVLGLENHWGLA